MNIQRILSGLFALSLLGCLPLGATELKPTLIINGTPQAIKGKFGSPAFITEWNKRYDKQQNSLRESASVVTPKYGYAAHAPMVSSEHTQGDYADEEMSQGAMRWSHMPLRVFVAADSQSSYGHTFLQSLDEWARNSGGRVSFVRAQSPEDSDITVDWVANAPYAGEAGNTRTAFSNTGSGPIITHAHIDIATTSNGAAMTDNEMRKTCLHELGHALGLVHTSRPGDIMYYQSNPSQVCSLTPRDSATIQRLYSL
jgi:predicted Zn-dependent protease